MFALNTTTVDNWIVDRYWKIISIGGGSELTVVYILRRKEGLGFNYLILGEGEEAMEMRTVGGGGDRKKEVCVVAALGVCVMQLTRHLRTQSITLAYIHIHINTSVLCN